MQGLADGYFVLPYTIGDYLAGTKPRHGRRRRTPRSPRREADVAARLEQLLAIDGHAHGRLASTASWARSCGTTAAWRATTRACSKALDRIPELREEFWNDVRVPASAATLNQSLEKAGRVADFLELGELMCLDALQRESRAAATSAEENQTEDGEALRDDENFSLRRGLGVHGRRARPRSCTRSRSTFENVHPPASGATMMKT